MSSDEETALSEDEFRVEVILDEEEHGLSLGDRLHSMDLDDEARERLGKRAIVTRDGLHLFIYVGTLDACREAQRVVQELLQAEGFNATVTATRWHPVEGAWKDAEIPLPESEEARAAEHRARDAREAGQGDGIYYPAFVAIQSYEPRFLRDLGL